MSTKLWQPNPDQIAASNLTKFLGAIQNRWGFSCSDYSALHKWSVEELEKFWLSFWDFAGVLGDISGSTILRDAEKMPGATFFPNSRLNFAENLLRQKVFSPNDASLLAESLSTSAKDLFMFSSSLVFR